MTKTPRDIINFPVLDTLFVLPNHSNLDLNCTKCHKKRSEKQYLTTICLYKWLCGVRDHVVCLSESFVLPNRLRYKNMYNTKV